MEPSRQAFGAPGTEPRWTHGGKEAVGTAYSTSSHLWFTLSRGVLNEVYYPTIDRPQIRDIQFLITGRGFFHEEKRHLLSETEYLAEGALGFRITSRDPEGRYRLTKEILCDPHQSCLLIRAELSGEDEEFLRTIRLYLLVAPHLDGDGWGDSAYTATVAGRDILTAKGDSTWVAVAASVPFLRRSCGYVGYSDAWQDITRNGEMTWEFARAVDGNVAMAGEIDLSAGRAFTVGVSFGDSLHRATSTLFQSLGLPFTEHRARFIRQWQRAGHEILPLEALSRDEGKLYRVSHKLLLAHEDKSYPGAIIASMSIPWGDSRGDEDLGGYHFVWTRDLCHSATGLLALGDLDTPLRSLIYLACTQRQDGGFYQNFWIDGRPFSYVVPLDEVAHVILLAWRLKEVSGLRDFDPYPMVRAAAGYLVRHGPFTPKERWEEISGYSPSTLAATIAALLSAGAFARERGDEEDALFLEDWADFLESHIEDWTVTRNGDLHPEISRHYIRILPVEGEDAALQENPDAGLVRLANQPPGGQEHFPAWRVVDPGFLELVRHGIRRAHDPLIEASLQVVDRVLLAKTPFGPVWRRYTYDGYGQRPDGGPFVDWGRGRAWPLLTGERGHYALAAGLSPAPYLEALEKLANRAGLLPQQVWDEADLPKRHLFLGRPTGAAMPFLWAHSEYIRLLRSARDGRIFDQIPLVAERYAKPRGRRLEIWKWDRQVRRAPMGAVLRVQAEAPFRLRFTFDGWGSHKEEISRATGFGVFFADLLLPGEGKVCEFTFFWPEEEHWEERNFRVFVGRG